MANLKGLFKDTAIYGMSSIIGRFLNYLLVPLYTHYMPSTSGDYGISTNVYAYTALILVLLTFGMETTLFRFANEQPTADRELSTLTLRSRCSLATPSAFNFQFSTFNFQLW